MSKRAERRHHAKRVADSRRKYADPDRNLSDNQLAERHPYDCGRHCLMCHGTKFLLKKQRRAEWRSAIKEDF